MIIGRGNRTLLYDIKAVRPEGLVKRSRVIEVAERVGPDGEILVPLDENAVAEATILLREQGVETIAICFLHSYVNPQPERKAAEIVERTWPGALVCTSSQVLPERREYELFFHDGAERVHRAPDVGLSESAFRFAANRRTFRHARNHEFQRRFLAIR
ncbi:MAG: hypothetical protein CM1200mP20_00840 [Pseudomonadota bacterium]|nr:MAG: hypothetical protein CM1200mP20_00840 [Pseudomonadota bacterium]